MKFQDYITDFIFMEDAPQKADVIFIPGCGYGELAVRAAGLYHDGFADRIVVSGRYSILDGHFPGPKSPEEYCKRSFETESDFLSAVMEEQGVPAHAILKEREATYTYENAIYTRKLLGEEKIERALLVCQAFHARRSFLYYKLLFPETELLVCPAVTREITRENWFLDENKIDIVLGEMERCGSQFHEILKEQIKENKEK